MRSSLEIANAARVAPIADIAEQAGIPTQFVATVRSPQSQNRS